MQQQSVLINLLLTFLFCGATVLPSPTGLQEQSLEDVLHRSHLPKEDIEALLADLKSDARRVAMTQARCQDCTPSDIGWSIYQQKATKRDDNYQDMLTQDKKKRAKRSIRSIYKERFAQVLKSAGITPKQNKPAKSALTALLYYETASPTGAGSAHTTPHPAQAPMIPVSAPAPAPATIAAVPYENHSMVRPSSPPHAPSPVADRSPTPSDPQAETLTPVNPDTELTSAKDDASDPAANLLHTEPERPVHQSEEVGSQKTAASGFSPLVTLNNTLITAGGTLTAAGIVWLIALLAKKDGLRLLKRFIANADKTLRKIERVQKPSIEDARATRQGAQTIAAVSLTLIGAALFGSGCYRNRPKRTQP